MPGVESSKRIEIEPIPTNQEQVDQFHSEWCFVSLILGIFGFVVPFIFSTLAIIFAIGGLMQANREGMKGKWMAITAIIFGIMSLVVYVLLVIAGVGIAQEFFTQFGSLTGYFVA